jgi:hypothetical protein
VNVAIGQIRVYLYRRAGREIPVEARIIDLEKKQITIEFTWQNRLYRRVLRAARERARLVDLPIPKPGAPPGNQNAVKAGPKKVSISLSLSGQRLWQIYQVLEKRKKTSTLKELRNLVYCALDTYLRASDAESEP